MICFVCHLLSFQIHQMFNQIFLLYIEGYFCVLSIFFNSSIQFLLWIAWCFESCQPSPKDTHLNKCIDIRQPSMPSWVMFVRHIPYKCNSIHPHWDSRYFSRDGLADRLARIIVRERRECSYWHHKMKSLTENNEQGNY